MKTLELGINVEDVLLNGGGTYAQDHGPVPESGYFISLLGHGLVVPVEEFTQELIESYIETLPGETRYIDRLVIPAPVYIGFWVDDGKVYLDASINVANLGLALKLGVRYEQQAIWDVEAGVAIPVRTYQVTVPETYLTTYEVVAPSEEDIRKLMDSESFNDYVTGKDLLLSHRDSGQQATISDTL